jgi:hypothetical protein
MLNELVSGWRVHFSAADREIRWLDAEVKAFRWLSPRVLVVGVVDALGINAQGKKFFGEWKTASPRDEKTWKEVWRKNPQSLTYGVLLGDEYSTFVVRKAFKKAVPTYDHKWYSYSQGELEHWKRELLGIAREMRLYNEKPWPTNFGDCFRYGPNYVCPFFEHGCGKENWDYVPLGSLVKQEQDWVAQEAAGGEGDVVVLSPTRVETWLRCRERFRKQYIERIETPATEALTLGKDFHAMLAEHYKELIEKQKGATNG